jgi:streptogramin lyase
MEDRETRKRARKYSGGAVAVFDRATGAFDEIPFPLPDALPYVARVDARSGAVWMGTGAAGVVARLDPAASAFPPRGPLVFRITPR